MIIKILQWNLWYKESPDNIVKEILKWQPDIICAQELILDCRNKTDCAKYIASKLGYYHFFHEADTWDRRDDKTAQGNVIFSKYPITQTKYCYVQKAKHNPPDASHEGRVYIEISTEINQKVLKVATTHLSYSNRFLINDQRKKEVNELVNNIKNNQKNYIFTGDLNSTPTSYTIQEIEKYLVNAGPDYDQNSWTTKPFDYHGFVEKDLNWRLDYVFATPDIKVDSIQIMQTKYSDHLPILATIKL